MSQENCVKETFPYKLFSRTHEKKTPGYLKTKTFKNKTLND